MMMCCRPLFEYANENPAGSPWRHNFSGNNSSLLRLAMLASMLALLAMLDAWVGPLHAGIYRYQDENGYWHFTDAPPDEALANPMDKERSPEELLSILANAKNPLYRYRALEQLKKLKDPATVDRLIQLLKTHPERLVRNYAASALGTIGDVRAVDPIIDAIDENRVDKPAYKALGMLGDKRALRSLRRISNDRNKPDFWRIAALKAIKKIEFSNDIIPYPDESETEQKAVEATCFRAVDEFKVDVPCDWLPGKVKKPSALFDCPVIAYERAQNKTKNPTAYMDLIVLDNAKGKELDSFLLTRSQGQLRTPSTDMYVSGLKGFKKAYVYDPPKGGYYSYKLSAVFADGQKILCAWGVGVKDFDRSMIPLMEEAITTVRLR